MNESSGNLLTINKNGISNILLDEVSVKDYVIAELPTKNTFPELVVYVVPQDNFSLDLTREKITPFLPATQKDCLIVVIPFVPYTTTGAVDMSQLLALDIIDNEVVETWSKAVAQTEGVEKFNVISGKKQQAERYLHLTDLLPERGFRKGKPNTNEPVAHTKKEVTENKAKPAIIHGPALVEQENEPVILHDVLVRAAKEAPNKGITYIDADGNEQFQSYPELLTEAQRVLTGLRNLGLKAGDKVILQIEKNENYIPIFWGCVLGGIVPLGLAIAAAYNSVNAAVTKLHNIWKMLERPIILADGAVAKGVEQLSGVLNESFRVEVVEGLKNNEPDTHWHQSKPEDMALLLLTSGSTGMPKGVVQTHHNLIKRSAGLLQYMGDRFTKDEVSLNWLPIDHVTGIEMCHIRDVYALFQQHHLPTKVVLNNPLKWLELLDKYRASLTWAPNFAFRLVNDHIKNTDDSLWDLSCVKFMENAGEPIVAKTCRLFLQNLAPYGLADHVIYPAWGMAETCSTVTEFSSFNLAETNDTDPFTCLGDPFPGFSMRIVNEEGKLLNEGEVGHFECKGASVLPGYYKNPVANKDSFNDEGWFDTGDLAFLQNGLLTLTGRSKDVIIINGTNYYGHEIESALDEIEGIEVSYNAAVPIWDEANGTDCLALFFNTSITNRDQLIALFKAVRQKSIEFGINPTYLIPVEKEEIPKTGIGKIQRTQLKKKFEAGGFDQHLRKTDLIEQNDSTIPDWFYKKRWKAKSNETALRQELAGNYLIFTDKQDLGDLLVAQLTAAGQQCIVVEAGESFEQRNKAHYVINPQQLEHYEQLIATLKEPVKDIIHLWAYTKNNQDKSAANIDQAQFTGIHSVAKLIQALAHARLNNHLLPEGNNLRLYLVSNDTQYTKGQQNIAWEKSPVTALLRSVQYTLPWLAYRHIDFATEDALTAETHVSNFITELKLQSKDKEIVYRNGTRLVPSLEKVTFEQPTQPAPVIKGGTYLITGGLGGLGTALANRLITNFGAKLILTGRSTLPDSNTWTDASKSQKVQNYLELEALGGEFIYEMADVSDLDALQGIVKKAEDKWGQPLSGIFHLAGQWKADAVWENPEKENVLLHFDSMFKAKAQGAVTLFELIKDNKEALFVPFSSVSGVFGASSFAAYAAANWFLDVYSAWLRTQGYHNVYCYDLSIWDNVGMSEGISENMLQANRNFGYYVLPKEAGYDAIFAALLHRQTDIVIGLNGQAPRMQYLIDVPVSTVNEVKIAFTGNKGVINELKALDIRSRFGVKSIPAIHHLPALPETAEGAIDEEALLQLFENKKTKKSVVPRNEIEGTIAQIWQKVLKTTKKISVHDSFFELGGTSILATQVQYRLEKAFNKKVLITELFEYPTIATFADFMASDSNDKPTEALLAKRKKRKRRDGETSDIAIVGMACRLPGAKNIEEFWQNLKNGVESIAFFSEEEVKNAGISPELYKNPDYIKANPIVDHVDCFDASFFGYSPAEASTMDPQQRFFLECAWNALEDAGNNPQDYNGSIGVFGGALTSTHLIFNVLPGSGYIQPEERIKNLVGNASDCLASRVSYKLNLSGPAVNVQTNCSTSLVAVHTACQSLLNNECDMALAGGVAIRFPQKTGYMYQQGSLSSPDGHCRPFDAKAGGTLFGDGAGVVVLKKLTEALEDGDQIYAVIKGSAINNDGALKVGYTAPSVKGQAEVIQMAQEAANVTADTITYIEAHGTATKMGDPIEVQALKNAFKETTDKKAYCTLGSVKANIGHLETAAGVAALIKTALSLKYKQLPATLHFEEPNPGIDFENSPFVVKSALSDWEKPNGTPRRGGISSFGVGGTNAHLIIEEAPEVKEAENETETYRLLPVSARTEEAFVKAVNNLVAYLKRYPQTNLAAMAHTLQAGRKHFEYRQAFVGKTAEELIEQFGNKPDTTFSEQNRQTSGKWLPEKVFMFPGGGSQYVAMAKGLLDTEPVFNEAFTRCAELLKHTLGLDIRDILYPEEGQEASAEKLKDVTCMFPAIFMTEYALAKLLIAKGITPDSMIGHSLGEYVAACLAGVFSLEEGLSLVIKRAELVKTLPEGAMLVVPLPETEIIDYLNSDLSLAVVNTSKSCVLSGTPDAVAKAEAALQAQGVDSKRMHITMAAHSSVLDPILDEFKRFVATFDLKKPQIPYISSCTSTWIKDHEACDPVYWAKHLRQTVRFSDGLGTLLDGSDRVFIEVGPGHSLSGFLGQHPNAGEEGVQSVTTLRHPKSEENDAVFFLNAIGQMWAYGLLPRWSSFYEDTIPQKISLPGYPFEKQRHWPKAVKNNQLLSNGVSQPFLHNAFKPAISYSANGNNLPVAVFWETDLSIERYPYLIDHVVLNEPLFPAGGYVGIAFEAARNVFGDKPFKISDFEFSKALFLTNSEAKEIQFSIEQRSERQAFYQILSKNEVVWQLHSKGQVRLSQTTPLPKTYPLDEIMARFADTMDKEVFYSKVAESGVKYGETFKGLYQISKNDTEAIGRMIFADSLAVSAYTMHPAALDICFQLALITVPEDNELGESFQIKNNPFFPVGLGEMQLFGKMEDAAYGYARVASGQASNDVNELLRDITVFDKNGGVILEIADFKLRRIEQKKGEESKTDELFYKPAWIKQPLASRKEKLEEGSSWLILADKKGLGQLLANHLKTWGIRPILIYHSNSSKQLETDVWQINPEMPLEYNKVFVEAFGKTTPGFVQVVHLWALDGETNALEKAQILASVSLTYTLQALVQWNIDTRLWAITQGVQNVTGENKNIAIAQASVWGLCRTISQEYPAMYCTNIDVDVSNEVALNQLLQEFGHRVTGQTEAMENQIAWYNNQRYVCRLVQHNTSETASRQKQILAKGKSFKLVPSPANRLDELTYKATEPKAPGANEVCIEVATTGINFSDVMNAMGIMPLTHVAQNNKDDDFCPWVGELAGKITATGSGVSHLKVGDEVMGMGIGHFGSLVTMPADCVAVKPRNLNLIEATCIPAAFLTSYYSLVHVGRINKGDKVLIHSATGGVGLSAVQIAQHVGAEIFATAGTPEKRDYLKSLGIRYVMDSRSLDFADEIKELTNGYGVDIVLNSLAGEAIDKNFSILAQFGKFIELGVRDLHDNKQLGLKAFVNNLTYSAISLKEVSLKKPTYYRQLLEEIVPLFEDGTYTALPSQVFPASRIADAFKLMAQAKHRGKIVIDMQDPEVTMVPLAEGNEFLAEATYLVTGGLSGLGLAFAEWLTKQGATNLALLSRRGITEKSKPAIDALRKAGVRVEVFSADVANTDHMQAAFTQIKETMPTLKGIIHSAGTIADTTLTQMDKQRFDFVMNPKVYGTWNLHYLTLDCDLDFFVCFSSVAATLGTTGQGNYAAANAFLDAFAHYRKGLGLASLTINWGSWAEIGLAAAAAIRGQRLASHGLGNLDPRQGIEAFAQLLAGTESQVAVMMFDLQQWFNAYPVTQKMGYFTQLAEAQGSKTNQNSLTIGAILEASESKQAALLQNVLKEHVSQVIGIPAARLKPKTRLNTLGLDSLMSIELKNRLEVALGIKISLVSFIKGTSLALLTNEVLAQVRKDSGTEVKEEVKLVKQSNKPSGFPLSASQQMYMAFEASGGMPYYNAPIQYTFKGAVNIDLIEQSIHAMLTRHEALRARFVTGDNQPQSFKSSAEIKVVLNDISLATDKEKYFNQLMRTEISKRFEFGDAPVLSATVYKLDEQWYELVFCTPLLLLDGWSYAIFDKEFRQLYKAYGNNETPAMTVLPVDYSDFVQWETQWLESNRAGEVEAYWADKLEGMPQSTKLPFDFERNGRFVKGLERCEKILPQQLYNEAKKIEGATPFMVVVTALNLVLYNWSKQQDFSVATSLANRNHAETQDMIGCFLNVLPMRAQIDNTMSCQDLLAQVRDTILGMQENQQCPYTTVNSMVQKEGSSKPVSNVYFTMETYRMFDTVAIDEKATAKMSLPAPLTSPYDLYLTMLPEAITDGVQLTCDYSPELFKESSIQNFLNAWGKAIELVLTQPKTALADLGALGTELLV